MRPAHMGAISCSHNVLMYLSHCMGSLFLMNSNSSFLLMLCRHGALSATTIIVRYSVGARAHLLGKFHVPYLLSSEQLSRRILLALSGECTISTWFMWPVHICMSAECACGRTAEEISFIPHNKSRITYIKSYASLEEHHRLKLFFENSPQSQRRPDSKWLAGSQIQAWWS